MTRRKFFLKIFAALAVFFAAASARPASAYPPGFVAVRDVIPAAALDIRYYGADNFVGGRVDGYEAPEAILTAEAAAALKLAANALAGLGYGIKIFDAYRPKSAVVHFVRWGRDPHDTKTRDAYYPGVDKSELFKRGYIAPRSGHSRGSTVDLTITHAPSGEEIDMGSPFDFFGEISHAASPLVTPEQSANRKILRGAMAEAGFKPISTEWWHFALANEPHPGEYFDFPVASPPKADGATAKFLDEISGGAERVITAAPNGKNTAIVRAYFRTDGGWTKRFETRGFFGRSGVTDVKHEGDGATPAGVYTFGRAFGVAENPGAALPYTKISDRDVWVDDPNSARYNQWADKNSPAADWKSAEHLIEYTKAYKYAVSINYNTDPVEQGRGSAIFLHCATGRPTAGCVSVPEAAMIFFLGYIDGGTRIAIGD